MLKARARSPAPGVSLMRRGLWSRCYYLLKKGRWSMRTMNERMIKAPPATIMTIEGVTNPLATSDAIEVTTSVIMSIIEPGIGEFSAPLSSRSLPRSFAWDLNTSPIIRKISPEKKRVIPGRRRPEAMRYVHEGHGEGAADDSHHR